MTIGDTVLDLVKQLLDEREKVIRLELLYEQQQKQQPKMTSQSNKD